MSPALQSTITCPACGTAAEETKPTDACMVFYECTGCQKLLKSLERTMMGSG
ncbi:MAG: GDCCVxC domain-containing (seleno)protein [Burkholderiales bacterium]